MAGGHTEGLSVEVNGELGSLVWELGALNQLRFFEATGEPATEGFRTIQVTKADHPYAGAWWPEGHTIGYEHTFTHEVRDLLLAIADNRDPVPSFADGLQVQEVLDAVQRSAASGAGMDRGRAPAAHALKGSGKEGPCTPPPQGPRSGEGPRASAWPSCWPSRRSASSG